MGSEVRASFRVFLGSGGERKSFFLRAVSGVAQGELEVAIYIGRTSVFWSFLGFLGGDFLFF